MGYKSKITIEEALAWQKKSKADGTIGTWKRVGRELRDKYGLTDRQAIRILQGELDE